MVRCNMKTDCHLTIAILLMGAAITLGGLLVLARSGLIGLLVFFAIIGFVFYRCNR